jgi:hypothetical protein
MLGLLGFFNSLFAWRVPLLFPVVVSFNIIHVTPLCCSAWHFGFLSSRCFAGGQISYFSLMAYDAFSFKKIISIDVISS